MAGFLQILLLMLKRHASLHAGIHWSMASSHNADPSHRAETKPWAHCSVVCDSPLENALRLSTALCEAARFSGKFVSAFRRIMRR